MTSADADTGAEAEEEHAPAVVAAERLHGGVVDHADGLAERGCEVEAHPAVAEIARLGARSVGVDGPGITDRDDVVVPIGGGSRTCSTSTCGVSSLPESKRRRSSAPLTSILT